MPGATAIDGSRLSSRFVRRSRVMSKQNTVLKKSGGPTTIFTQLSNSNTGNAGMWRFYTDDSPGFKVGPVPVLLMSLLFIACVFLLHIWGKYNKR